MLIKAIIILFLDHCSMYRCNLIHKKHIKGNFTIRLSRLSEALPVVFFFYKIDGNQTLWPVRLSPLYILLSPKHNVSPRLGKDGDTP